MDDQVTLRVYFLDGTSLGIGCTRLSTVGEVRDLVVAKLRLPPAHAACFELYVAPERGPLCDELAREAIASGVDLRERSAGPPRRLTFAVRLYVDGATLGVRRRKATLRLCYAQACSAVSSGEYAAPSSEALLELAALRCRGSRGVGAQAGEAPGDELRRFEAIARDTAPRFLPKAALDAMPLDAVARGVAERIAAGLRRDAAKDGDGGRPRVPSIGDATPRRPARHWAAADAARAQYLDVVETWFCHGLTLYDASAVRVAALKAAPPKDREEARRAWAHAKTYAGETTAPAFAVSQSAVVVFLAGDESSAERSRSSYFGPLARKAAVPLAKITRWGHTPDAFFLEARAEDAQDVLRLVKGDRKRTSVFGGKRDDAPRGLARVIVDTSDGAHVAELLRDYAIRALRRAEDAAGGGDDDSTTDDDGDGHRAVAKRHWRAAAEAVIFASSGRPETRAPGPAAKAKAATRWKHVRAAATEDLGPKARAAIGVQAVWKGAALRRRWAREDAAALIQSLARAAAARTALVTDEAACLLQALARGRGARAAAAASPVAAVAAVAAPPRFDAADLRAAVLVQSHWRRFHVHRDLTDLEQSLAAVHLQAVFRGHFARAEMA